MRKQKVSVWGFNVCNTKPLTEVLCNSTNIFLHFNFSKIKSFLKFGFAILTMREKMLSIAKCLEYKNAETTEVF